MLLIIRKSLQKGRLFALPNLPKTNNSFARGGEPPPPRRGIARLCLARGERGKKVAAVEEISNELPFS